MLRTALICLLIAVVMVLLPGCTATTDESTSEPADQETPVTTEFGRMLGYVPYSFIEDHDIWFGNPGKLKGLYGVDDITGVEELMAATEDIRKKAGQAFRETGLMNLNIAHFPDISTYIGFDIAMIDRILYGNIIPPRGYYILEGDFDEVLIGQKLIEQGYTETDYGNYSYYGIRGDFEIDIKNPLGRMVMGSMNRIAVLDNTVIFSPVAADITGIFDVMVGNTPSTIENTACRALADSLGDVVTVALTTPERIIFSDLSVEERRPVIFKSSLAEDWDTLHGYEMAALGYRVKGDKRFFDIALYYTNAEAARADGEAIVKRMESYTTDTWVKGEPSPVRYFTDQYSIGEPVIEEYPEGIVLKISCQLIPEERRGVSTILGSVGMPFRDILFLAPDPSEYIGKNESPEVIIRPNP